MDQMEHFSSSLELQLQVQAKNTDAHPTPQHEKSAYRDHSYDRHDFFPLGLFHDLDSVHVAIQRHAPHLPKAAFGRQAPAESAAITIDKDDRLFLEKQPVDT